jgi:hypothetical protein
VPVEIRGIKEMENQVTVCAEVTGFNANEIKVVSNHIGWSSAANQRRRRKQRRYRSKSVVLVKK